MHKLHAWWSMVPEWAKPVLLLAAIGLFGWIGKKVSAAMIREITSYLRKRHARKIDELSHQIWEHIKKESHGLVVPFRLSSISADLGISEADAKAALRLLKAKELVWDSSEESLWYSDQKARFFE